MNAGPPSYDVVVPTVGRPSLHRLLDALARGDGPLPTRVLVVDDRPGASYPLLPRAAPKTLTTRLEVLRGPARGPAAARNVGWRAATAPWVAFLDDDVVVPQGWRQTLADDLAACAEVVAGSQGRIVVSLPTDRRPTDWERNVAGLEQARWATADMAYRRDVLAEVGGFDERFPRAYREDADIGLRITQRGHRIEPGRRHVLHPVGPAPWHVSVAKQAGNADDALMHRLYGPDWHLRAGAPRGSRRQHLLTTAAAGVALGANLARRPVIAGTAAAVWTARTAELAWRRIAPGPRTAGEVGAMVATSTVLPVAATVAYGCGVLRARRLAAAERRPVQAVLFDRDGTLVTDVPYNGDPDRVAPVPGARASLDRLRRAGLPVAIVSNQSGVARGLLDLSGVAAVNARVEELLGPFAAVLVCPHGPDEGCPDRKPAPGMVQKAAAALGVPVERCVVIGDIGSDVDAALAAGARPILVPTTSTRTEEIAAAPVVAPDLATAVDLVLDGAIS